MNFTLFSEKLKDDNVQQKIKYTGPVLVRDRPISEAARSVSVADGFNHVNAAPTVMEKHSR